MQYELDITASLFIINIISFTFIFGQTERFLLYLGIIYTYKYVKHLHIIFFLSIKSSVVSLDIMYIYIILYLY